MAIQITGSWDLTGSFTSSLGFQGTASYATTASFALTGGSGGSTNTGSLLTTASVSSNTITFTKGNGTTFPITVATGSGGGNASLVGNTDVVMFPFLGPITSTLQLQTGSVIDYYVTSSGTHVLMDIYTSSFSASVNVRFNTSTINDGQYVYVIAYLNSGSANVAVTYRTIISNPGNLPMYSCNTILTGVGNSSTNLSRNATSTRFSMGNVTTNPLIMQKISGSIVFTGIPYLNYLNVFGPTTGSSFGTPIV